ncbi:MAG: alanine racemase [Bacteroidales bacterium]|nr:alanine racemase [Bacteroidales bacterium]
MFHTSVIEISKSALVSNLKYIRKIVGKNVRISSVIKGNAYGHHIESFVPIAEECGLDHFSVFSAEEALRVKNVSNGKSQIMIMGIIDINELPWAINNQVEFYVFDFYRLEAAIEAAKTTRKSAIIHLEIETGMNRTGFDNKQFAKLAALLKENEKHLVLEGICTHYAGAESIANYHRVMNQIKVFNKARTWFENEGIKPHIFHSACSAAAVRYPKTRMNLVRIGIMQYGFWSNAETLIHYLTQSDKHNNPLKRLISWKSRIMGIKEVKTGEFIGYGTTYLASRDMRIATIPIGYAQGFSRSLGNQGRFLIGGERVSVIGTVNMNLVTVDITNVPQAGHGDEVVIIGEQGDLSISVASFSELSNQLNYELLTRLPDNIPRIIID